AWGAAARSAAAPHAVASPSGSAARSRAALPDDSFTLARIAAFPGAGGRRDALVIEGASSERGALHGAYDLLERLGARFALGRAPTMPRIEAAQLATLAPYRVAPAFSRRAFVSDIMTWHYEDTTGLRTHLAHDREFTAWMGRRGINAFSYIRHAQDTRLKI